MFDVLLAGFAPDLLEYRAGLALQQRLHADVVAGRRIDTLVLAEHTPVYSAGRDTTLADRPVDGVPVVEMERAGGISWHGPGQLAGYPIVQLDDPHQPARFVRDLHAMLVEAVATLGVRVEQRAGGGIWGRTAHGPARIGAIAIRVRNGVTMHGFSLNCSAAPPTVRAMRSSTLSDLAGHPITPADVADAVVDRFEATVHRSGLSAA